MNAHGLQLCQRAVVAHGDEAHAVADEPHHRARPEALDRTNALCIEHDGPSGEKGKDNDRHVVIETTATRDILQQTATARHEEVGSAQSLPYIGKREP